MKKQMTGTATRDRVDYGVAYLGTPPFCEDSRCLFGEIPEHWHVPRKEPALCGADDCPEHARIGRHWHLQGRDEENPR